MDAGALDCCHGPTERDIWQNAWFPKPSSVTPLPTPSHSTKSSQSTETCTKPPWQTFLWVRLPPNCSASSANMWSTSRRKSPLYTLLTCEAAHFMERLCIGGEVCDI